MRRSTSIVALAASLALALAGLGGTAARAADEVKNCPTDPWLLVAAGDGNAQLADRNGDGSVCLARVSVRERTVLVVLTDNSIGNPGIIPPGPCTEPLAPVAIGNPGIFPGLGEIDANTDGTLCAAVSLDARALILVLVDNPNAIPR